MMLSICVGFWAYLYTFKFTQSEEVFSFMPDLIERLISFNKKRALTPVSNPNYLQNALQKWGYKCATCHSGIVALVVFSAQWWLGMIAIEQAFCYIVISMMTSELLTEIKDRI